MFDVAVGERAISHMGHIKMMGAVQPFISGAISKTVNLPQEATVEDIADAYIAGVAPRASRRWRSTATARRPRRRCAPTRRRRRRPRRPTSTRSSTQAVAKALAEAGPRRKRMPRERQSITHKFSIGGHEGYITAGMYEDGTVGEIFLTDIGKEGSTLRGMMNSFATAISIALQYGVPLETLVQKFSYMRFEPEGITSNPEIPFAKSMPDYIMRWLASRFLDTDAQEELGILTPEVRARKAAQDAPPSRWRLRHRRPGARRAPSGEHADGGRARRQRRRDRADRRADRHAAGRPGAAAGPRPRAGLQPVRRDDAADGLAATRARSCGNNTGCG